MAGVYRNVFRIPTSFGLLTENSPLANTLKRRNQFVSKNLHTCNFLAARVAYNLSDIGEGIRDVVIKEWYVKIGDRVQQFDNICEVQSDKASVTITSRYDGTIIKLYHGVDDTALVGQPLVDIETDEGEMIEGGFFSGSSSSDDEITHETLESTKNEQNENIVNQEENQTRENTPVLCIPSVRRLAKEHSVDLTSIKGTGKGGRILKEDILKFLEKKPDPKSHHPSTEDRIEPIKGFQKTMVKTMTESLKIPLFVYGDEIKVSKISELRKTLRTLPELNQIKISFLPFFVKALSNAMHQYPVINSSPDEKCENLTYYKSHNIGIAMDTKVGLAVPVIKNAEKLSIIEIAKELNRLMQSGRDGSFSPSDLSGGTFSISNIGAIAGTYMKPIPLPPQVAIIALGASQVLPRFDDKGNVTAEEILNVSVAADHRIIDGATVAKFTQNLKRQIENPYLLFLNI